MLMFGPEDSALGRDSECSGFLKATAMPCASSHGVSAGWALPEWGMRLGL